MRPIVVVDIETKHSANDCRHCGKEHRLHFDEDACEDWRGDKPADHVTQYSAIGWGNKAALGISIGCAVGLLPARFAPFTYGHWHLFDEATLVETMEGWLTTRPLLVSFNGQTFDFALMRATARHLYPDSEHVEHVCQDFKVLAAEGYDVLQAIWQVDPKGRFAKGNGLDAVAQANGMPAKAMDGASAPRLWAQGQHAAVINYCMQDVLKTAELFRLACHGIAIVRGEGLSAVTLARPEMSRETPLVRCSG